MQPFLVMHLDILPDAIHSVEDALKFFAAPESLEGYKPTSGKVGGLLLAFCCEIVKEKLSSMSVGCFKHCMQKGWNPLSGCDTSDCCICNVD